MKGMVRQRGKTWTAYWWTPDPATGTSKQHSKGGFDTKTAAQKHLTATVAKVHAGEWSPEHKLTVRELLKDHWLPARSVGSAPAHHSRAVSRRHRPMDRSRGWRCRRQEAHAGCRSGNGRLATDRRQEARQGRYGAAWTIQSLGSVGRSGAQVSDPLGGYCWADRPRSAGGIPSPALHLSGDAGVDRR